MAGNLFALTDRVVIVTGAARGLGRALAKGLASQGARVVIGDLNQDGVTDTADTVRAAGGQVVSARLDVTDAASCEALVRAGVAEFGRIDVLVNNAGIDIVEPMLEITAPAWEQVLNVDLRGVLHMSQPVVRQMIQQGQGGSIINLSSIASSIAIKGLGSYSAAKSGVNQLTRVMAVELAAANIRVNAIAPGYLENIMQGLTAVHADPEMERNIRTRTPLGRRARLDELVGPISFLASDAASYVTGAILYVDGGYSAA
jgi:NAD(P)-dependent dehydrogenase (short-subunit alcohol dehydrogenase family)